MCHAFSLHSSMKGNSSMIRKTLAAAALVALSSNVLAYGAAGCGLGSVIFKDQNGWVEQVLAATTNGTSGNQTFGITTGTLNCEGAGGPLAGGLKVFIDQNLEQIAMDSARGQGETLDAMADMMGMTPADEASFKQAMQSNFDRIFPNAQTNGEQASAAIAGVMADDARLALYLG